MQFANWLRGAGSRDLDGEASTTKRAVVIVIATAAVRSGCAAPLRAQR
ncbi:hypothetical protein GGC64_006143 [Mycobacterium sp. OAS707]|nr:hypothetical protein [Mycobacterium sp. OAS707]